MQKPANRILSALLALIMVISLVPATVFAAGEADVFAGWSLTLGDHIGVNFYLAEEAANYTVTTTVAGTNAAHTTAVKDGKYVVTVHVAAAQMTDTIGLTVMNGETQVHTGEYSVRQYAVTILTGEYDAEVKEMVKEMLNYGAAAQTYFEHNTGNLANAGYVLENNAEISQEVPEIVVTDELSDLNLYGMSLLFRSKTAVRFYFSGSVEGHTFTANGAALNPVEKDEKWYIEVDGINPQDLASDITVSVDDGALTVTYSPMTYIVRMFHNENSSQELKALTQAMYGYHLEALDYQEYQKITQLGALSAHADPNPWVLSDQQMYLKAMINVAVPTAGDYRPLTEDAVKLVRNGVTYNVGKVGVNTLVLQDDMQCLINISPETIGDLHPLQAHDYLIIEGRFNFWNGATVQISKTYVYYDGAKTAVSTTVPTLPTVVDAGVMQSHPNGHTASGIYFRMDANDAYFVQDDWTIEYKQTSADNFKIIRNGETISIGISGRPLIVKYNESDYYLNLGSWNIGDYAMGAQPNGITTDDILVIEGGFEHTASKTTLNITKTYIYYTGTAWAFSATEPVQAQIHEVGVLSQGKNYGTNGMDIQSNGVNIYAIADANTLPYSGWNYEYTPVSAENLKLIRDGVTYDVGYPGQGTIVKFNENGYCIKMYPWTVAGGKLPLVAGDILIIEGQYTMTADSNVVANFAKTYILVNGDNTCSFSATEPVLTHEVDGGNMSAHADGLDTDGNVFFALAENALPVDDNAEIAYTATSDDAVVLVRKGQSYAISGSVIKFGDADYALALDSSYLPLQNNDYLIVSGSFANDDNGYTLNIAKTYILVNNGAAEFSTTEPVVVIQGGMMMEVKGYGWTGETGDLIFQMDNAAPTGEYAPTSASNIKLIRNGETYDVGYVGVGVIEKSNDTWYTLKFWTIVNYKPMLADDILVVEGNFKNTSTGEILNITKTYVKLNGDKSATFSATEPAKPSTVDAGVMQDHPNGMSGNGLYFRLDANDAFYTSDWTTEYAQTSADNIKLIRNGETISIGIAGRPMFVKFSEIDYYLKLDTGWTIGKEYAPITTDDILIVEGSFEHAASKTTLNITKTYIYYNGSAWICSATEPVLPIQGGMLMAVPNYGWTGAEGDLIFQMSNSAPTGQYAPTSASNIKLIRNGETHDVGYVGVGVIEKSNDTWYTLKFWTIVNYKPMLAGDILVVEGNFKNTSTGEILNITKTYVKLNGDKSATFSATEPVEKQDVAVVNLTKHSNGWTASGGLYFRADKNDAPFDDWNVRYKPVSTEVIKVVRNGVTYNVANKDAETIVKFSDIDYYMEFWPVSLKPMQAGDMFIVEGKFYNAANDVTIDVEKTYIVLNADSSISISTTEPVEKKDVEMKDLASHHANGWTSTSASAPGGMYFCAPANDAPYSGWDVKYTPATTDTIKLIRNGETVNIANTGAGTIIKFSDTEYYFEFWPFSQKPMLAGDVIIVEGKFYNAANDATIVVEKTYFTLKEGGQVSVMNESGKYINAGVMSAHTQNWFNSNHTALYFTLASNAAPSDSGWNVRYKPAAAGNVKLVRNGETVTIGNTGAETIVKIEDTLYAVALDAWWWSAYAPIQEGDTLIIEGEFTNASNGYTLNISKTVISIGAFANDAVVFGAAADTEFGSVLLPTSADTVNIGMWNGSYHAFNDTDLQRLQAIGITKIMGIDPMWLGTTGAANVRNWLDKVYSYGISVILDMRSWDGTADYAWMTYDGASVVCTLQDIMDHPAIIGFLMFDEPCSTDFQALADTKAQFDEIVKDKLFFVNLFGSSAAGTSLVGVANWAAGFRDYDKYYVSKFLTTVGIDVLSWDSYCLVEGEGIRTGYFYNFEVMASKADSVDDIWYTMLSSGHETTSTYYTVPTEGELRWQMAVAMTYGIHNIDHYTYVSHEDDYSCMVEYDTWEPTDLYYDILTVDNEFLSWDHIYMAYDWVGVGCVDVDSTNEMFSQLKNKLTLANYGVTVTSTAADLLVGVFEHQGDHAYMVTNAGTPGSDKVGDGKEYITSDTTVTLTLAEGDYKCAAVIVNGELTYVAVVNNTVTVDVDAYGYAFVIPVLN